jgi:hypothetical protein
LSILSTTDDDHAPGTIAKLKADHQMIASIVSRVREPAGQPGANAELA